MRYVFLVFLCIHMTLLASEGSDDLLLTELSLQRKKMEKEYAQVSDLYQNNAPKEYYLALMEKLHKRRKKITKLEEKWRQEYLEKEETEEPSSWELGEVTIFQMIMQYGSTDYLYIIPSEIGGRKLHLFSTLPIPHSSWDEMIALILSENGVGIKKLSPFLRQLYIAKHDPSSSACIAATAQDLASFSSFERVIYIFSPPAEQLQEILNFFERFSDPKMTALHIVGNKIIIASTKQGVENLLSLYQAVWAEGKNKCVQVISLKKGSPEEVKRILEVFFQESQIKARPSLYASRKYELFILPLEGRSSLILVGDSDQIEKAKEIVDDLENQLESNSEMMVYWYTCRHSDPEELAAILDKVYISLSNSVSDKMHEEFKEIKVPKVKAPDQKPPVSSKKKEFSPPLPVQPKMIEPKTISKEKDDQPLHNFIVDPKTGSILMVIRREDFSKIQRLLKKLDIPKKMVEIEVLLVEKKVQDRKQSGINLLKIGSNSSQKNETSCTFDASDNAAKKGILDFIISRAGGKIPAFDLTLNFLMGQDDIRINANPSVLAINQTPATISIAEELSINNGAVQVENSGAIEKSYTRAQYGIFITMVPTIHIDDDKGFITLQTDVTFDTTQTSREDRPPVTRRHIKNEVRIADGETIILGGLRRSSEEDSREKIPFLGDLPGIGKLFGTTKLCTNSTEMFIFITPRIVSGAVEGRKEVLEKELGKRAGDLPEFLEKLQQSQKKKHKILFEDTLKTLLDL